MEARSSTIAIGRLARVPNWLHGCALFLFVFLAFTPTTSFEFITYDDPDFVVDNPNVNTGLSWENLKWAFASPGEVNLWNPLTSLSHQLDVSLFGLDPAWHHAMNVFWHALAASLLFLISLKLSKSLSLSYFIALLWALHSQNVQSVAWISERKGVLSGAFFFASILLFTEWQTRGRKLPSLYCASLLFYIAAALAKPSVLPLPLVLLLLFGLKPGRFISSGLSSFRQLAPFFIAALVVAGLVVSFRNQGTLSEVGSTDTVFEQLREVVMSYTFYLTRFSYPVPSQLLFTPPTSQFSFIISLSILGLFVPAVIWLGRHSKLVPLGAAVYTVLWLPISGIIPISHYFVADRYSYLPQLGLILIIVGIAKILFKRSSNLRFLPVVLSILVFAHFVLLQKYLPLWRNSETLFGHEMRVNPASGLAPVHYGEFFQEEDPAKALRYYEIAHRNAPHEGMPLTKMGMMQRRLGKPKDALGSFLKATRVTRSAPESWTQLLLVQVDLKLHAQAEDTVSEIVQRFPHDWRMLMNGGNFHLLVKKDPKSALPLFLRAHKLKPREIDSIRACLRCYQALGDDRSASRFERLLPSQ